MSKIKNYLGFLMVTIMALSACQPIFVPNVPGQSPTDAYPFEDKYNYAQDAIIESLEVLLLESFPLQASVKVAGFLRDGCSEIFDIKVEREEMEFIVVITTRHPAGDVACTEALVPFEEVVDLDIEGLNAGTYTVIALDQQAEFTLDVENSLSELENGEKYTFGSHAVFEDMYINLMESFPVQVSVTLKGYLPDGCTKIHEISSSRDGNVFTIEVTTKRPSGDVACTMAIVPFEETIQLDVKGLSADEYEVRCGAMTEAFTLEQDNEL